MHNISYKKNKKTTDDMKLTKLKEQIVKVMHIIVCQKKNPNKKPTYVIKLNKLKNKY